MVVAQMFIIVPNTFYIIINNNNNNHSLWHIPVCQFLDTKGYKLSSFFSVSYPTTLPDNYTININALFNKLVKENWGILLFTLVLFASRSSFADWYVVPNGSMLPTIVEGDRIFVDKMAYQN
jgi:hypothetical protein